MRRPSSASRAKSDDSIDGQMMACGAVAVAALAMARRSERPRVRGRRAYMASRAVSPRCEHVPLARSAPQGVDWWLVV